MNPSSRTELEIFALNGQDLQDEIARSKHVREFVTVSMDFSVATGRREGGEQIVFIKSHTPGELHAVVFPDPDASP